MELEIGRDLDSDDFFFERIVRVASSGDGRIFVLDAGAPDLKVFGPAGKYLTAFGRAGAGPREFTHPADLLLSDSSVSVTDVMQRRLTTYTLEGKHIETRRFDNTGADRPGYIVYEMRGGSVLIVTGPIVTNGGGSVFHDLYTSVLLKTVRPPKLDTLVRIRADLALYRRPGAWIANASTMGVGDGGAWALLGDSMLALVNGHTGMVRWMSVAANGARVQRSAKLSRKLRPVTRQDVVTMKRQSRAEMPYYKNVALEFSEIPTHWSVASRALFADNGSLWIGPPYPTGSTGQWTVFPSGNANAFSVSLPSAFTLSSVRGERLYGHAKSEDETPIVQVYAMPSRSRLR
ncbi:MAG: 6-bladed beta-propeller [Gemmatimonadaceae bacterium]|nr:6-bladed beta-propeller [Gemmatimonadaceae bacterium]MDQ3519448.1 6-bladed beta-propeller [Gemmatimonadota bacterium]